VNLYIKLWPWIKPYWVRIIGVFFFIGLFALSNVYFLVLIRELSDDIVRGNINLFIYRIVGGMMLALMRAIAMYGQTFHMSWLAQRVIMHIRVKIYSHLQKLSLDFHHNWKTGEIMSRATNDLQVVQSVFVANMVELIPEALTFVGVLIYLFTLNWKLLLLTFITLPLFSWLIQNFSTTMKRISKANQRKLADLANILQETLYGITIIKAFAREKREVEKYSRESERSFLISMKSQRLYAIQSPVLFMLQTTMILVIFMVGGIEIISGGISVGNFLAFVAGLGMLVNPITAFGKVTTR